MILEYTVCLNIFSPNFVINRILLGETVETLVFSEDSYEFQELRRNRNLWTWKSNVKINQFALL